VKPSASPPASDFSNPASLPFRLWTADEKRASMRNALKDWLPGQDVWIYGYGSLIWRPDFEHRERRLALLRGHHRALCLWSRVNRGTPECPGLVFGLDRGGSCRGVVYRLAGERVPEFFPSLWDREMSTGAYLPRWLNCTTELGDVKALVFVMNRANPAYISALPEAELIATVRRASGHCGPCTDYIMETVHALREAGIRDARLENVAAALQAAIRAEPQPVA